MPRPDPHDGWTPEAEIQRQEEYRPNEPVCYVCKRRPGEVTVDRGDLGLGSVCSTCWERIEDERRSDDDEPATDNPFDSSYAR